MTSALRLCEDCVHSLPTPEGEEGLRCRAFPLGIPVEIVFHGFDHRKEFPGDNGIRYKPPEGKIVI